MGFADNKRALYKLVVACVAAVLPFRILPAQQALRSYLEDHVREQFRFRVGHDTTWDSGRVTWPDDSSFIVTRYALLRSHSRPPILVRYRDLSALELNRDREYARFLGPLVLGSAIAGAIIVTRNNANAIRRTGEAAPALAPLIALGGFTAGALTGVVAAVAVRATLPSWRPVPFDSLRTAP